MSNATENDTLKMSLVGIDPSWRASANVYLALFTADPTEAGVFTNEATFTGYARVTMAKATAWTDGGSTFTNSGLVQFLPSVTDFQEVGTYLYDIQRVSSGIKTTHALGQLIIEDDVNKG
jgi:hypothetical protein